jgi:hypothetical protein
MKSLFWDMSRYLSAPFESGPHAGTAYRLADELLPHIESLACIEEVYTLGEAIEEIAR